MAKVLLLDFNHAPDTLDDLIASIDVALPRLLTKVVDGLGLTVDDISVIVERERAPLVILVSGGQPVASGLLPMLRTLTGRSGAPAFVAAAACVSASEVNSVLEEGARDLIALPVNIPEAAGRLRAVLRECGRASAVSVEHPVPGLVGTNEAFLAELRKIPVVAACEANVLISGETGTGKELCAQAIHNASARRQKPFVPINCGAIPHDLIENELFGHERGAFTGASQGRPGLVQEANGGTLFLDEINSLPMSAQVKLLRVLQDGTFRSLGSNRVQQVNLRIVAASNEDLHVAVQDGRFRKDLYYRLNVIPIRLPALRERRDDIPLLAQLFVSRYAERTGKTVTDLTQDALAKLVAHDWPGNVRELEHIIERAVVLASSSRLRARDLSLGADEPCEQNSFQEAKARVVRDFERGYLRSVLSQCRGNISQAAVASGKDRRAFWELMRKHDINPQEFRQHTMDAHRRLAS